jgi:hypothetical protein
MVVGVAQAGSAQLNQDLPGSGLVEVRLEDFELAWCVPQNRRASLHRPLLLVEA